MLDDTVAGIGDIIPVDPDRREEERWKCARCGHLVTTGRWRLRLDGEHVHLLVGGRGEVLKLRLFTDAPGALAVGSSQRGESPGGFGGYLWRPALCAACDTPLGWMYEGTGAPAVFFGLLVAALQGPQEG